MQKSFIDRLFPQPSSPLLPTAERERGTNRTSLPHTPSPVISRSQSSPARSRDGSAHGIRSQRPVPLSASIIHHNDPLLPVDRAARALQRTIQSLLDAQSDGLSGGLGSNSRDDVSSAGSLTPTPSIATPPRSATGPRTTPVRQPVPKKVSLRGARKGLIRSMQDFAQLKEEEMRILESQSQGRQTALDKLQAFEGKRSALVAQIETIKAEGPSTTSEQLKTEAQQLDTEIKELEDKLFELKARQRHVLAQASQIENSVDAKLSSYNSSLEIVNREIKQFLKTPPIPTTLSTAPGMGQSMFDLKAERRTLEMAKEQWTQEQGFLEEKRLDAEHEKMALREGLTMWQETVDRITAFEKELRAATKNLSDSAIGGRDPGNDTHDLLPKLDVTISALEGNLHIAEKKNWNLLICCISPELEAFQQGRAILRQTLGLPTLQSTPESEEEPDGPSDDLMNGGVLRSPGTESNKSLDETMKAFGDPGPISLPTNGKSKEISESDPADRTQTRAFGFGPTRADSESEEDDPGPDFFLSHP